MKHLMSVLLMGLFCGMLGLPLTAQEKVPKLSLENVKVIYVMPMKDRMDHYLTSELVKWGRYEVTLNLRQADAILSDVPQIDVPALLEDPSKVTRASRTSRGTAFLIAPKSQKVIWSASKNPTVSYLVHTEYKTSKDLASELVEQMKKDASKTK